MARFSIAQPDFLQILRSLPGHHIFLRPDAPAFSIVEVSDDFGASLKTARQNILGKSIFEVLPDHETGNDPNLEAELKASLSKVLREKEPHEMPVQKRVDQGTGIDGSEERYWRPKNIPVLDEAGNVTYVLYSVADVTVCLAHEISLTCSPVFEGIAGISNEGIWHRNLITRETRRFGEAFYGAFGSALTSSSPPEAWEQLIHPEERDAVVNRTRSAIETPGEPQTEETYRVLKTDGTYADVSERTCIIRDQNGVATEMYGKVTDITFQKKNDLERELRLSELIKSNFELKQFTSIASHNLRTPIANLIGLGNLVDENKIKDPLIRKALEKYKQATLQLSKNVNDLFEMLTHKNTSEPKVEEIAIDEVFKQVQASAETLITDCGAEITTDFSAGNRVKYLPGYLHSIFLNFLTNAIKYRSPKRKLKIKVTTVQKDNVLLLHFTDNGLGMDLKKYGDKVFGLYQKFHNHPDSTGLGLHLVATQVKALGGNIWVSSEPDRGSTFTIQFN